MVKKFQITMSNKLFYTLIVVSVMGLLGVGVYAYNSGASPSVMGHSAGEIEGVCRTDGTGCPAEKDPTVTASVKDGVSWAEVTGKPAGFADGVDNEGSGVGTLSCTPASLSQGSSGYSACSGQTCVFVWKCIKDSGGNWECTYASCSFTVKADHLQSGSAICCKVS